MRVNQLYMPLCVLTPDRVPDYPCTKKMSVTPVSRETFLQQASFYSALSQARPDDKLVLIRLPKEMCAADLDGQSVSGLDGGVAEDAERTVGKISVKLRSMIRGHKRLDSTSVPSSSYTIKSSRNNLKVNSLAFTQPSSTSSSAPLASAQQMRLGKSFDEFWNVNLGVEVDAIPIVKISKIVKKRAERPLVEQPKNLRMRLLPFNTPRTDL